MNGAARLLLSALRDPAGATLDPEAVDLALAQGVAPYLHARLEGAGALGNLPPALAAKLADERHATALANLRNYGEFRTVARCLDAAGIPPIPLKGLHLAELVYGDVSLRPMADLDILVPRERVSDALAALRDIGFGAGSEANDARGLLATKCNIGLAQAGHGNWLEVHWALDEAGGSGAGPVQEIWREARAARVGDVEVRVMPPELLLLHVCTHLAYNHAFAFSLRALCDIERIVQRHPDLDWRALVRHATVHRVAPGARLALLLAREGLGVAVPEEAVTAHDFPAAIVADAWAQLLGMAVLPEAVAHAPNLVAVAAAGSPGVRAKLLWARLFVSREELAVRYGIPARSLRLWPYYGVRWLELLRRYGSHTLTLDRSAATRHLRLRDWLRNA